MQVPNIFNGLGSQTSSAKAEVKTAAAAAAGTVNGAAPPSNVAAMREIVSQYDMADITPTEFSSMIQQLSAKGAISSKDMQELSTIRVDLETAGVGADESVNLQDFYQQRLTSAQAAVAGSPDPVAAQSNVQALAARMTWVQKFAAVRQQGATSGVNAVA